jgi:hypothetical protein
VRFGVVKPGTWSEIGSAGLGGVMGITAVRRR